MSPPTRQITQNVYLLPLTDGGAPKVPNGYVYLPPPTDPAYAVRFQIPGTSPLCRQGSLWINVPEEGETFDRSTYREFKLKPNFTSDNVIDIPIHSAGAYAFYSTYQELPPFSTKPVASPPFKQTPTYYIDVCPRLMHQGSPMPVNALNIFSVISKFMGKYPADWHKHLRGISQRGYNMVHFTPLMMRGDSNSPYSIYDQHQFDKEAFPHGEKDIQDLIKRMREEHGLMAMTDVVWNHTANNSKWLEAHPEGGYNVLNSPHLIAAFELDSMLLEFGDKMSSLGYPTDFKGTDDLLKVMEGIKEHVVSKMKLWEYYVCDKERDAAAAVQAWSEGQADFPEDGFGKLGLRGSEEVKNWPLKQKADWLMEHALKGGEGMGDRFQRSMDAERGAALLSCLFGRYDSRTHGRPELVAASTTIARFIDECNLQFYREYDGDCAEIMEQLFNRIKYTRIDDHGPKIGPVTKANPLIESYFTRLPNNEITRKHDPRALAVVNNGWVWAADAMRDNAGPKSRAYLRREVIVWGDCVKLRYGTKYEDNPFLWDHISEYTRKMATYFGAFRIDNCHSTPIAVAEYMLDQARLINPNLVVGAELFSGSETMDFYFCKRMGITFLIREAMQAWSTQEMSRLVHRHAGVPIGSFDMDEVVNAEKDETQANGGSNGSGSPAREVIRTIKESPVHALFMDCTHDNEVPAQKRDARDTLPNAALVAMCASAAGSVMGYDEIYPQLIELVHEKRLYSSPYSSGGQIKAQAGEGGIGGCKKLFNQIHTLMGKDEYDETFIHHDQEYITVHRVHPYSRKGYFCIAHTAFPGYGNGNGGFAPVHLPGSKAKLLGAWMLDVDASPETKARISGDKTTLKGLPSRTKDIRGVKVEPQGSDTVITVPDKFPPGSVAIFETWIPGAEHSEGLDKYVTRGGKDAFNDTNLSDVNYIMYRCEPEERDATGGKDGVYTIPGHGPLVYAGMQGWWSCLKDVVRENNLGHPICNHLREGTWALDYCLGRLQRAVEQERYAGIQPVVDWFGKRCKAIKKVPSFLLPRYFAMLIQTCYNAACDRAIELMSDNVKNGHGFLQSLALVSCQVTGYMDNASLWPDKIVPSLSAGLPHFSSSWARVWGRDVFISLRGLYLGTGRFADAREHILAFASVIKHGMIPNLLSSGKITRYNSRDSVWFFTQNIQDYTKLAPDGMNILGESVKRRFLPNDDTWFEWDDPKAYSESSTIGDCLLEILQRHAEGMDFIEANAGPQIDSQMQEKGFNISIQPDWENGLIFGGNQYNCGTWMDKMGESEKAGSQGVPGTPRDGCAIEICCMLYSTLRWVQSLNAKGLFKYDSVKINDGSSTITFKAWADLIKSNFERCFYIPRSPAEDKNYDVNPAIVNRRGIYKDLYRSGKEYEDYQLRPNFPIGICVAPDLFDQEKALYALKMADTILRGPTGMATLDPGDLNYRPNYINSEDSTDFHTSKGRNYHQGPEWLWPTGFFLRALLRCLLAKATTQEEKEEAYQQVTQRLAGCMQAIQDSPWAGLTELTNKDGSYCADSSPTQAWSSGCIIDLYQDAHQYAQADASA